MNTEILTPSQRLIVAADYDPKELGLGGVRKSIMTLATNLRNTGVTIKVNSFLRATGYTLIDELNQMGLQVFADLKLVDIPKTMEYDGAFLQYYTPDILTAMCTSGSSALQTLQKELPETEVLGVTVLTSQDESFCKEIYGRNREDAVLYFAHISQEAKLKGLICSPKELPVLSKEPGLTLGFNTPGIRPKWSIVKRDDQTNSMTPFEAIRDGAKRIVVGRPITTAKNPLDAVQRTLEEIEEGFEAT